MKTVAILGTAFKPETDDVREAPGIKLAEIALAEGLKVYVHDYKAIENTKKIFGGKVTYCLSPLDAVKEADIVFLSTIWPQYCDISDQEFENNLKSDALFFDCRSLYKQRDSKPWRIRVGVGKSKEK